MKHATSTLALLTALSCGAASAGDYYPYAGRAPAPPASASPAAPVPAPLLSATPAPYAPPPYIPPPAINWTGFYAGLNVGGTFSGASYVDSSTAALTPSAAAFAFASSASGLASLNYDGFIGGGQIGYNYQFTPALVAGVEADIQGTSAVPAANQLGFSRGAGSMPVTTGQIQRNIDYLGTVRARLGYLLLPNLQFYVTGGLAYGGVNLQASYNTFDVANLLGPGFGSTTLSSTQTGYAVGGGAEYMFWPNWSAKLEYLYYNLGSISSPGAVVAGAGATPWAYSAIAISRFDAHVVRAGLNYHFLFGAPPPVVAKY